MSSDPGQPEEGGFFAWLERNSEPPNVDGAQERPDWHDKYFHEDGSPRMSPGTQRILDHKRDVDEALAQGMSIREMAEAGIIATPVIQPRDAGSPSLDGFWNMITGAVTNDPTDGAFREYNIPTAALPLYNQPADRNQAPQIIADNSFALLVETARTPQAASTTRGGSTPVRRPSPVSSAPGFNAEVNRPGDEMVINAAVDAHMRTLSITGQSNEHIQAQLKTLQEKLGFEGGEVDGLLTTRADTLSNTQQAMLARIGTERLTEIAQMDAGDRFGAIFQEVTGEEFTMAPPSAAVAGPTVRTTTR